MKKIALALSLFFSIYLSSCGGFKSYHSDAIFCPTQYSEEEIKIPLPITIVYDEGNQIYFTFDNGYSVEDLQKYIVENGFIFQEKNWTAENGKECSSIYFLIPNKDKTIYDSFLYSDSDEEVNTISNCACTFGNGVNILFPFALLNVERFILPLISNNPSYTTNFTYNEFKSFYQRTRQKEVEYFDEENKIRFYDVVDLTIEDGEATFYQFAESIPFI